MDKIDLISILQKYALKNPEEKNNILFLEEMLKLISKEAINQGNNNILFHLEKLGLIETEGEDLIYTEKESQIVYKDDINDFIKNVESFNKLLNKFDEFNNVISILKDSSNTILNKIKNSD